MMEIWKQIKGFEGAYEVSNTGKVKSLNYHRQREERILKARLNRFGYPYVSLCKNGKVKSQVVHRLVAEAFIENPDSKKQVNHKDGNKTNNNIENLEWCTNAENTKHAYDTGLKMPSGKPYVACIVIETGKKYLNMGECAKDIGGTPRGVQSTVSGKQKTHRGFHIQAV